MARIGVEQTSDAQEKPFIGQEPVNRATASALPREPTSTPPAQDPPS
jgi:hypothetical protein